MRALPSTYAPTMSPDALIPKTRVAVAPGMSTLLKVWPSYWKPWNLPDASRYAREARRINVPPAVWLAPGYSNGMNFPIYEIAFPRLSISVNNPTINFPSGVAPLCIDIPSGISSQPKRERAVPCIVPIVSVSW